MGASLPLGLAVFSMSSLGAAVASGRSRTRVSVGVTLASLALLSPLLVPADLSLLRFALACGGLMAMFRVLDLARDESALSARDRLWLFTAVFDVREVDRVAPELRTSTLLSGIGHLALVGLGVGLALHGGAARFVGGVLLIYGLHGGLGDLTTFAYALVGIRVPLQYRHPILARSVGAFWARHYNLNVSRWLSRHIHRPLVRAGFARLAAPAAFAFSAAFHAWIAWVCLEDVAMAGLWGAFFVLQGVFAAIERVLRVSRRARPAQHAWTVGLLLATSPLFVEPFLRILSL